MTHRVLLIDDNRDLIDCLAFLMEDMNIQVVKAYDLAEAKSAFQKGEYDLVFLDIRLPDGNGLGMYYEIKANLPATVIVPMTGFRLEQILHDVNGKPLVMVDSVFDGDAALSELDELDELTELDTVLFRDIRYLEHLMARAAGQRKIVLFRSFQAIADAAVAGDADIIVLCLSTTIMDLFAMVTYLRDQNIFKPVLLFLDKPAMISQNAMLQQENTGCIFKPFDPQKFLEDVHAFLALRAPGRDAGRDVSQ